VTEGERLFNTLQDCVVAHVSERVSKLVFDKRNQLDFAIVTSYCSILEKAWALLALVDKQMGGQGLPILRAQFETFADLKLLCDDAEYIKHLELRREKAIHKRLILAKSGNPYLGVIAKEFDLEGQLSEVGKRMQELKSRGAKLLEPAEKFEMAELSAEREAIYAHLSDHSHGGIGASISRHMRVLSDEDFEIAAFQDESKDNSVPSMQTSLDIVLRASQIIHEYYNTGEGDYFQSMIESYSLESA